MPMSYHVNIKTNFLNQIPSGVGVVRAFYELPSNLKLKKEMKKKMILRIKSEDPWAFSSAVIFECQNHEYQVNTGGRTVMQTVLFFYLLWACELRQSS